MHNTPWTPAGKFSFPVPLRCPWCQGLLVAHTEQLCCQVCERAFPLRDGIADLVVGSRFPDAIADEELAHEDQGIIYTTHNYWLPLLRRLFPPGQAQTNILSLGCGTGADVDLLCDAGFNGIGVDNGNRARFWSHRRRREHFLLANGCHLAFENHTFDCIYCSCVFPHVGVEGDTYQVGPDYARQRLQMAREMMRVLKPGGKIIVASPNRRCGVDLFHGRVAGRYVPRFNRPTDPFLLSAADYRRLFFAAGCQSVALLPSKNYWGFLRSKQSRKGRLFAMPVRLVFWLVSQHALQALRASPLNPWLVMLIDKG